MTEADTSRRIVGIDVARCLALLGMMATHILPSVIDGQVPLVHQMAAGRASALFAVLAGLSLGLVAGTRAPLSGRPLGGMLAGTAVRAAVLGFVGLLLGSMASGIAVILVYYAVLFVVAVPFMALPTRILLAVTAGWAVLAPLASHWLRSRLAPTTYAVPSLDSLAEPVTLLRELLLTGYYPVLSWVPYVLLGVLLSRLELRSDRTALLLVSLGSAAALLAWQVSDALTGDTDVRAELIRSFEGEGWQGDLATTLAKGLYGVTPTDSGWWLAVRAPHTGTTFDLLMTAGSALAVLGVCLVVGRRAPRVLGVLFGAGAMTLTLYSLHVTLRIPGFWDGDDWPTFLGQAALVLAIGAVFRAGHVRGPLEQLTGELSSAAREAVAGRPEKSDTAADSLAP